jgi:hypothetical protein
LISPVSSVLSWFFSVLGLERADADAVLFRDEQTAHADVFDDLGPVAFVALHQLGEDVAARRVELALDVGAEAVLLEAQLGDRLLAPLGRDELERLLVHGRGEHLLPRDEVAQLFG